MVLWPALPTCSQVPSQGSPNNKGPGWSVPDRQTWDQAGFPFPNISDPIQEATVLHELRELRQKALITYSRKLFKLAAELNAEIAQSRPGSLSKEELHKVAEIEKLAQNFEQSMKMSYGGNGGA